MSDWSESLLQVQDRSKQAYTHLSLTGVTHGTHREANLASAEHALLEIVDSARNALAWVRQERGK